MADDVSVAATAESKNKTYIVTNYWQAGNLSTYNVTPSAYYADAEKLADGYGSDGNLCWAAAASNILQAQGWNRSFVNEDRSLDYFMDTSPLWGGYSDTAISWWITGKDLVNKQLTPPGGGFYSLSSSAVLYKSNAEAENSYPIIVNFATKNLQTTEEATVGEQFFSLICNALESGYCLSLGIGNSAMSHAITCWGYEIDGNKKYLYITDSDDNQTEKTDRRLSPNKLQKYEVVIDKDGDLTLTETYTEEPCKITDFCGLAAYDPVYEGIKETTANATELSLPSNRAGKADVSINGTIALAEDLDYYGFESSIDGTATISLSAARSDGTCNLKVSLLDEDESVLQTTSGLSPAITANISESKYYILVESNGQKITMQDAPYTLTLAVDAGSKPDLVFTKSDIESQQFVVTTRDVTESDISTLYKKSVKIDNKPAFFADENIYVFCVTGNEGTAQSTPFTVQAYVDDKLVDTVIAPGGEFLEEASSLNLGKLSPGQHSITVTLNEGETVPEIRYSNNTYSWSITVGTAKNHTCGSDFNGNSIADITLVRKNGTVGLWTDADSANWRNVGSLDLSNWSVAGSGDFKRDGKDDLLLVQKENGIVGIWSNGNSSQWTTIGTAGSGWKVLCVMDFNHNGGRDDIVLMNDQYIYVWQDGSSENGKVLTSKDENADIWTYEYKYLAAGDFEGYGKDMIVFLNEYDNQLELLYADGNFSSSIKLEEGSGLKAVGDFNHDEYDDMIFAVSTEDGNKISYRDSCTAVETTLITLSEDWEILGARDYNNDSYCDILLKNTETGVCGYWHGCATGVDVYKFTTVGNGLSEDWAVIC